jgi:hypothetical protein
MQANDQFRALLEAGDVPGLMGAWNKIAPHLPQPTSLDAAEIVMHMARTAAESVTFKARAYSHRWLTERDLQSHLPDQHRPAAERLCPTVVEAVGISVSSLSDFMTPAANQVQAAMENAVLDVWDDKHPNNPAFVTLRMNEARDKAMRALFG